MKMNKNKKKAKIYKKIRGKNLFSQFKGILELL